jgi:transcriptional antiterminator RfaH
MPCLPAEPALFPEDLFDSWTDTSSDRQWWALYTKARQEKALARHLFNLEIPFYLPLVPHEHLTRRKRVRSYLPLFSGYIFLYGTTEERISALTSNRISRVLTVEDESLLVRDLHQLRRLIESDAPVTIEQRLTEGDRVRIKSGAIEGVEGVVISRRGRTRLLVAVTFLQQGVSMEIEDFQLEPVY